MEVILEKPEQAILIPNAEGTNDTQFGYLKRPKEERSQMLGQEYLQCVLLAIRRFIPDQDKARHWERSFIGNTQFFVPGNNLRETYGRFKEDANNVSRLSGQGLDEGLQIRVKKPGILDYSYFVQDLTCATLAGSSIVALWRGRPVEIHRKNKYEEELVLFTSAGEEIKHVTPNYAVIELEKRKYPYLEVSR
jgi:hypothetical protein